MAEAAAEVAPAPAKKKGVFFIIVIVVVLSLLAGGVSLAFLLKSRGSGGGPNTADGAPAGAAGAEAGAPAPAVGVLSLEPFVSNLADPEGDRYVKCTMRLVLDTREAADRAKTDDLSITRIRDRILTLLASKTFAEVSTPAGKEALRAQIRDGVSEVLAAGKVGEVYYTEFIVQ